MIASLTRRVTTDLQATRSVGEDVALVGYRSKSGMTLVWCNGVKVLDEVMIATSPPDRAYIVAGLIW
jgi:hypothetical protein